MLCSGFASANSAKTVTYEIKNTVGLIMPGRTDNIYLIIALWKIFFPLRSFTPAVSASFVTMASKA